MAFNEVLSITMLLTLCVAMLLGFPVAFTLAGIGMLFALLGTALGIFDFYLMAAIPSRIFGLMTNHLLVAVPLFIFMGVMLERSKVANELLTTMSQCFGALRGGLGLSVTFVGMLIAASTGIVGATVVTMGVLSLPTMLRAGYSKSLACGTICASGSLGQIIPPSIALILLGSVLAGIYSEAQLAKGVFIVEPFSVTDLFAGALLPGLLLVGLYMIWLIFVALIWPQSSPAYYDERMTLQEVGIRVAKAMVPPLFLIAAVLGSILGGIATPTEAASFGSVGALILAATRRQLTRENLRDTIRVTTRITCMVFTILIGATMFSLSFRGFGGDDLVTSFLTDLPGGFTTSLIIVMIVVFLLGFVLDFIEIVFIVVPIVAPALLMADISPVWLGVIFAMNLQTSFLTPPFGWALFYLRGTAPDSVRTQDIYLGVAPFVVIQLIGLGIVIAVPGLATWLPDFLYSQ